MIIVLPGADFSENNIGTIQLIRELSPEVAEILSHYSRALTDSQKFAFQDFYDALISEGIWSKIENLFIPALASTVAEAFYPVKGNGVINEYEKPYELKNHGLWCRNMSGQTYDNATAAKVAVTGSGMNYHLATYLSYVDYTNLNETDFDSVLIGSSNYFRVSKYGKLGYVRPSWETQRSWGVSSPNFDSLDGPAFVGVSSGTDELVYEAGGLVFDGSAAPLDTDLTFINAYMFVGSNVNNASKENISQALISQGSAMSESMMLKYNQLADDLMAALL